MRLFSAVMKDAFHIKKRSDAVLRSLCLIAGLSFSSMLMGAAWAAPIAPANSPAVSDADASYFPVTSKVATDDIAPIVEAVEAKPDSSFGSRKERRTTARNPQFNPADDVTGIASPTELTVADADLPSFQQGKGSWYGPGFHQRRTANGELYDMNAMTAAHKTLPFGTMVLVKSPTTGKSVVVRINDRGPYAKGRVIDLSRAAAAKLGVHNKGTYSVVLYKLPKSQKPKKIAGGS